MDCDAIIQRGGKRRPAPPPTPPMESPSGGSGARRRWGDDNAPQGGPGVPPWRIFGDFLFEKKVTRGGGAERPHTGGAQRRALALLASGSAGPPAEKQRANLDKI